MAYTYENAIKEPITLPNNLKNKLGVCGVWALKGILVLGRDKVETPVTLRDRSDRRFPKLTPRRPGPSHIATAPPQVPAERLMTISQVEAGPCPPTRIIRYSQALRAS